MYVISDSEEDDAETAEDSHSFLPVPRPRHYEKGQGKNDFAFISPLWKYITQTHAFAI